MTTAELSARQIDNARRIILAAAPYGRDAAMAAVMAARAESSLLVTGNEGKTTRADVPQRWRDVAALSMQCPRDRAVSGADWTTADSVGLYQQRPMMGYCSPDLAGVRTLMDIEQSTLVFLTGGPGRTRFYLQAPAGLSLPAKVQWTQGSEFPTGDNYQPFEQLAELLVAQYFPTSKGWQEMATPAEVKQAFAEAIADSQLARDVAEIKVRLRGDDANLDIPQRLILALDDLQQADDQAQNTLNVIAEKVNR